MAEVHFVDVSNWQKGFDWRAYAASGARAAVIKASEGVGFRDPSFTAHRKAAQSAGLVYLGLYHFARPSGPMADGVAEADSFLQIVGSLASNEQAWLDIEIEDVEMSPRSQADWAVAWLERVESRSGKRPGVYASSAWLREELGSDQRLARYPLWIAHWGSNNGRVSSNPATPWPWTFHQFTSSGRVAGWAGRVDVNRFRGTWPELAALAGAGVPAPVPVPAPADPVPPGLDDVLHFFFGPGTPHAGLTIDQAKAQVVLDLYRHIFEHPD